MRDVWPIVHAERAALIHDLEGLDDEQWEQPSLCEEWTIHDVVAHLVDTALTTRLGFVIGLARARFDFDRQNMRGVARRRGASTQETLAQFRQVASRTSTPPAPRDTRIVEEVVHGEDILNRRGSPTHTRGRPSSGHFAYRLTLPGPSAGPRNSWPLSD